MKFSPFPGVQHSDAQKMRFQSEEAFDRTILESPLFRCVASLGSLVPGWVLISPKRATLNFNGLNSAERAEIRQFVSAMRELVEKHFGPTCMFEHGATREASLTGCGVDQAHLHIVPLSFSTFETLIEAGDENWVSTTATLPHELVTTPREYLWYSALQGSRVSYPRKPQSQFFRRIVAQAIGLPNSWDYKAHPFLANVEITQEALSQIAC